MSATIAITGATGFIGSALVSAWSSRANVRPVVRAGGSGLRGEIVVGDVNASTNWEAAVAGAEVVVHCAGLAHVLVGESKSSLPAFREVNLGGSISLARSASAAGVKRLILLSSVGVMGDTVRNNTPLRPDETPRPTKAYAVSKLEAENALKEITDSNAMELYIIRPPMVYGPKAPANFRRLLNAVQRGVPMPLGSVTNPRSFVGIDNLADMLWCCAQSDRATPGTYFASDGEDLSTADFVSRIGRIMGKAPWLIPVPPLVLRAAGRLLGRSEDVERLLSPLRVDISDNHDKLNWQPCFSVESQLEKAVSAFLCAKNKEL